MQDEKPSAIKSSVASTGTAQTAAIGPTSAITRNFVKDVGNEAESPATSSDDDPVRQSRRISPTWSGARGALISLSIILCQGVQMIPFGAGISGSPSVAEDLGLQPSQAIWIAASYPLTQGAFVLMGGRLGAVYGHKNALFLAGVWWVIFNLVGGFMRSLVSVSVVRALTGIGGAFIVPNAIALLTITFPPGKMRNISVALFGAMAPIGAAGGCVVSGFFGQLTPWWWLYFFFAILGTLVFGLFFLVVPAEERPLDENGKIDYIGAYFGVGGLILFNFVWTQSSIVGWSAPYIYALLVTAVAHLVFFIVWEARFASQPIMPLTIWNSPSFSAMMISTFLSFMSVGLAVWYISVWNIHVRGYTIFLNAAGFSPLAVMGVVGAFISAHLIRYVPAQYLLASGAVACVAADAIIATMPVHGSYWSGIFPAMIITGLGPDFLFTAAQIIASNTVRRAEQGVAGSLIGTLFSYGLSTGLGFAGTVEHYTNSRGNNPVQGYRSALYLGIGMAAAAVLLAVLFVKIPKDVREGWNEEDQPAAARNEGSA